MPASIPVEVPAAAQKCIVINGVSKAYAMTGGASDGCWGPPTSSGTITALQSHATSNVANVSQYAALEALAGDQSCVEGCDPRSIVGAI